MKAYQICARLEFGDAVSNHVLEIDRALASWGFETTVYASTMDRFGMQVARPDSEFDPGTAAACDLLIFHYSVYCANYRKYLAATCRRVLIYHNITPPEFFAPYDKGVAEFCRLGRELLPELSGCDLALADSEYNRLELEAAGFRESATGVLPVFVDYQGLVSLPPSSPVMHAPPAGFNVVFVGRAVPNKRLEDVIRAFSCYHHCINSNSRLYLVGASWVDRYDDRLRWLVDASGLTERVHFTGRVSNQDLAWYYRSADLFLSMSRHEGFGVPLVECMAFGVPVLALKSSAVPFTLGGAGIVFSPVRYPEVAELMELVRTDAALRDRVVSGQQRRLEHFEPESIRKQLQTCLEEVLR